MSQGFRVTLEQLKNEFDIKHRQLAKMLIELYEKTKGLGVSEKIGEVYVVETLKETQLYGPITLVVEYVNDELRVWRKMCCSGAIPEFIEQLKKIEDKNEYYETLRKIAELIPRVFEKMIEKLKEANEEVDERIEKLAAILAVLK